MSLTAIGFSLVGAFGGAALGLFAAYPHQPGKFVLGGAALGALLLGGGNLLLTNDDLMNDIKCAVVVCEDKPAAPKAPGL